MIFRLALRELWHARGALLLQVASLTIAIAALSASVQLNAQTTMSAVPGARCADEALQLSWIDGSGNAQDGWTPRQTQALMQGLSQTPAAPVMISNARAQSAAGPDEVALAFVGPAYFDLLCVPRQDPLGHPVTSPFQEGVVADAAAAAKWLAPRAIQVDANTLGVQSTTDGFKGLQYTYAPVQAWAPYSLVSARGEEFLNLDAEVVHVLIHPGPREAAAQIEARLNAVRKAQASLFAKVVQIQTEPALQISAWTASKIRLVTGLLRLFAGALLLLVLVNLLTYHAGRLPSAQALATTLSALGVPPAAIWWYAAIEPVGLGILAILAGSLLSVPLGHAALAAVTNESVKIPLTSSWAALGMATAVAAMITAAIIAVRGQVLTRRQTPSRNRAQRLLLRWLPVLLAAQVALAAITLTLAAQAAAGLLKALPPAPNFPLVGLSVVEIDRGGRSGKLEHVALRWGSAWSALRPPGYQAALATQRAPFLPAVGWGGSVGLGGKSVECYFNFVTSDFFSVLGSREIDARAFNSDVNTLLQTESGATHSVLNAAAARELYRGQRPEGSVLRVTHELRAPVSEDRASVVVGIFDDGIVGARGAVGKLQMSQLSMQASVPVVYQSLTELREQEPLLVFARHPDGASASQISAAILPAIRILIPGARIAEITDAKTMFRNPLRKERAMALVLALLASASLAIGVLGMISLMTMLLRSLKVELAVRYAVGATRRQAAHQLLKRLAPPALIGLVIGAVPAGFGLFALAQTLETAGRAGAWGPIIGGLTLALAGAAVLFQASRQVLRAQFMDWLRYE